MPDISQHPGDAAGDDANVSDEHESPGARRPRSVYLWWAVGIAILVLFLALHMAGVIGAGGH
jgi:hypothetical protein